MLGQVVAAIFAQDELFLCPKPKAEEDVRVLILVQCVRDRAVQHEQFSGCTECPPTEPEQHELQEHVVPIVAPIHVVNPLRFNKRLRHIYESEEREEVHAQRRVMIGSVGSDPE